MARSFILVIFAMAASTLSAQFYNTCYHKGDDYAHGMVTIGSSVYYIERSQAIHECCSKHINLVCVRDSGKVAFRTNIGQWDSPDNPLVAATPDSCIVIGVGTTITGCDLSTIDYSLYKVDSEGNLLWQREPDVVIEQLVAMPDNSIIFAGGGLLWKCSPGGILTQTVAGLGAIKSMCSINSGELLVCHVNGAGTNLRRFSNTLQAFPDVLIGSDLSAMQQLNDGSILGLDGGTLKHYSPTFTWTASSNTYIPSNYSISSFTAIGDTIYCAGKENGNKLFYMMLSPNFYPIYTNVSNIEHAITPVIAVAGDRVNILSTCYSRSSPTQHFTSFSSLPKNGTISADLDIGVVSSTVSYLGYAYNAATLEATVTVKNFGNKPVQRFHLNYFSYHGWGRCVIGLNKEFTVSIAPGDSVTLPTGPFYKEVGHNAPNIVFVTDICIFTTVPNNQNDSKVSNDEACKTVSMTLSLTEETDEEHQVNIFPNPGNGTIYVEAKVPVSFIEIFDMTGRLQMRNETSDQKSLVVSHQLPQGVYLLRLHAGERVFLRKVVVGE